MNILIKFSNSVDLINEKLGIYVSWLTLVLVITVCVDVFTRYLLNDSSIAVQELEWHFFAVIFLLGSAYTFKNESHVRVDVFYSNYSEKGKAVVNLIGSIFFLIPFSLLVIYASKNFVNISFNLNESSPDPGGLPARYILKSILPISFIFLLFQGLSQIAKSIIRLAQPGKDN